MKLKHISVLSGMKSRMTVATLLLGPNVDCLGLFNISIEQCPTPTGSVECLMGHSPNAHTCG